MLSYTPTSRPGSRYGSGWIKLASTNAKIATLAPIPSASINTAVQVNPGFLRSCLTAKCPSRMRFSIAGTPFLSRHACLVASIPPNCKIAARRASCALIPARRLSSICSARCASNSAATSRSRALARPQARQPPNPRPRGLHTASSLDPINRARIAVVCSQSFASFASCFRPARVSL